MLFTSLIIDFSLVPFGAWVVFCAATLILLVHGHMLTTALRLIVALDTAEAAVDAVFDAIFGEGRAAADTTVLAKIGAGWVFRSRRAIALPEVKQRLRANTDAALAWSVFGVPTTALNSELFGART